MDWFIGSLVGLCIFSYVLEYVLGRRKKYWENQLKLSNERRDKITAEAVLRNAELIVLDEKIRIAMRQRRGDDRE